MKGFRLLTDTYVELPKLGTDHHFNKAVGVSSILIAPKSLEKKCFYVRNYICKFTGYHDI